MQSCRSIAFCLAGVAALAFTAASGAEPGRAERAGTAQLAAPHDHAQRLPAVALSYDSRYLAWIVPQRGNAELVLASGSARHPHAVALPGHCRAQGIRWARRQNELAVLTRCASGPGDTQPIHTTLWLVDVPAGTPPRRLAAIDGFAEGLQWASDSKRIAFLYHPAAASAAETGSSSAAQISAAGGRSVVAAVAVAGGPLQVLTPAALYVHEFRLARIGHAITYTATPASADGHSTPRSLYSQRPIADTKPALVFDPGTAQGSVHDLQITLPRWSRHGEIYFLGRLAGDRDATGSDLYRVVGRSGKVQNLTGQQRIKPTWFTFHRGQLLVTQRADGQTQVAGYRLMWSWARQTALFFTVPGVIGDGRATSAISVSYRSRGPHIAYFQRASAQASPVLHVGLFKAQPPPRVDSTDATPPVDSTSVWPAD